MPTERIGRALVVHGFYGLLGLLSLFGCGRELTISVGSIPVGSGPDARDASLGGAPEASAPVPPPKPSSGDAAAPVPPSGETDAQVPALDSGATQICGTATSPCPENEFCAFSELGTCGNVGLGRCEPRPELCDSNCEVPSVCGCDGRLYCSPCAAQVAGVDVAVADYCSGIVRCGSWLGPRCLADSYCDYPDLQCGEQRPGQCNVLPVGCPAECNETCGCDGVRYCNECVAHLAGVDKRTFGECAL